MDEIKDVIVKTLLPIQKELAANYYLCQPFNQSNLNCFELLGFDIMLDSKCKPVLLEVNLAPSFRTDSPLDLKIKFDLIKDVFTLIGMSTE